MIAFPLIFRSSRLAAIAIVSTVKMGGLPTTECQAMPGESFDASSDALGPAPTRSDDALAGRRFVGVKFECCATYARIYINREDTDNVGNCPRCAKQVRLKIGAGGTEARFFTVR
jgi:hypothetical protein